MAALAGIEKRHQVLEPSAGYGALALQVPSMSHVTCIELNEDAWSHLKLLGFKPIRSDFLRCFSNPIYDRVLMNPP